MQYYILGIKTFLYYLSTSLIAIIIGLSLSNIMQPGIGAIIVEPVNGNTGCIPPNGYFLDNQGLYKHQN